MAGKTKTSIGGAEALFAAAFLYATTNVLVREMTTMWGNQAQLAARFGLVWLILTGYGWLKKSKKKSIPKAKLPVAIAYSVLAAIAILFYTLSIQKTTIANTLFTSSATEIVGAFILGTLLLGEKLTGKKAIAIILSLIGLALYSGALLSGNAGIIYGLLAGGTTAFCNLLAKKLNGVDRNAVLRIQFGLGTLLAIGLMLAISSSDIIRTISIEGILTTIVFAVVLIVATNLTLYGFQHFDINIASVILSSQLAFGVIFGYFIYREIPATHEILSGLLIAAAAIIGSLGQKRVPTPLNN